MLKLFLSNLSQGPIKVSLFQGQSFSQLDIYVVNHFLVIDVVFTKIPITHKMLHIVVEPFRRLRNSPSTTSSLKMCGLQVCTFQTEFKSFRDMWVLYGFAQIQHGFYLDFAHFTNLMQISSIIIFGGVSGTKSSLTSWRNLFLTSCE